MALPDCDCSHSACCGKISLFYNHHIICDISFYKHHINQNIILLLTFFGNRIPLDDIPECVPINANISSSIPDLPQLGLTLHFAFPGEFPLNLLIKSADCETVCVCVCVHVLSHLSRVRLYATRWNVALQTPLSVGFTRPECWSGLPCPPPGDLPKPRDRTHASCSEGGFFTAEPPGKPTNV